MKICIPVKSFNFFVIPNVVNSYFLLSSIKTFSCWNLSRYICCRYQFTLELLKILRDARLNCSLSLASIQFGGTEKNQVLYFYKWKLYWVTLKEFIRFINNLLQIVFYHWQWILIFILSMWPPVCILPLLWLILHTIPKYLWQTSNLSWWIFVFKF